MTRGEGGLELGELAAILGVSASSGSEIAVQGLCTDSRHVYPGALFFAVPGTRDDGGRHVEEAVRRGACAVVHSRSAGFSLPASVLGLAVDDVRVAKARAAHYYHGDPSRELRCIGVTGTNGKTTVATVLHALFLQAGWNPTQLGTTGLRFGAAPMLPLANTTPDPLELVAALARTHREGGRMAVMEASSHALVQRRLEGVRFDAAIFTQMSREHLDYHGSVEEYAAAKALLFEGLDASATAVINAEDPFSMEMVKRSPASILTYGAVPGAHVRGRILQCDLRGSLIEVRTPHETLRLHTALPGRHNMMNVLAAVAPAEAVGLRGETLRRGIARLENVPGRLEMLAGDRGFDVLVDYAHTDDALEKVLHGLRPLVRGRLLTVFGCGGDRDREKRPRMGRVAATLSHKAFVTSDNPRGEAPESIAAEVLAGIPSGMDVEVILDRREAISRALAEAREGDAVLIAGKGHESVQWVEGRALPFDDRRVTEELLCRLCG